MTYGHLQADCLYTGISSGPNARYRVWEAFTFLPPAFGPCLLWPNDWMDQDATWNGGIGLSPGLIVLDGDLGTQKGHSIPHFLAHVYGQTVAHLSNC